MVTDHIEKATLFWQEFRDRTGVSSNPRMLFNHQDLYVPSPLDDLLQPFTAEEIDSIIKQLLADKVSVQT